MFQEVEPGLNNTITTASINSSEWFWISSNNIKCFIIIYLYIILYEENQNVSRGKENGNLFGVNVSSTPRKNTVCVEILSWRNINLKLTYRGGGMKCISITKEFRPSNDAIHCNSSTPLHATTSS